MTTVRRRYARRGMTLLELILALTITALVAAAIAAMLHAVGTAVGSKRDNRTAMVRSTAAQSRLTSYVAPSCSILAYTGTDLTVWLGDFRKGGTVHATEIRWLIFDAVAGTIDVYFVDFPDGWSQVAKDLADPAYDSSTDWNEVLNDYMVSGWISRMTIVDGIDDVAITTDEAQPLDVRHVNYDLSFPTLNGSLVVQVAATIREHVTPSA